MFKKFLIIYLTITLSQCNLLEEKKNRDELNANLDNLFKTEKLDEFYNYFKTELKNGELKKFYLKLLQLDSDTQKLVNTHEFVSDKAKNDFLNSGIKLIHKNFLFDKSVEKFIKDTKMVVYDSLEDNFENLERLDDNKKPTYSKINTNEYENLINKPMKKNSDFMKVKFDDVHPKFFDDAAFETENYNQLENFH